MPKLVILNHMSDQKLAQLQAQCPDGHIEAYPDLDAAQEALADADAVALWGWVDPRPILQAAPKLRWLHSLSAGIENLLPSEVKDSDIILTNSAGIHDIPVAERILAMMLALAHRLPEAVHHQSRHEWKRLPMQSLEGKTVLIAGFGGIGRETAKRTRAFGMKVVALKRHITTEPDADLVITQEDLHEQLALADFVICALPGTPSTDAYFRAAEFAAMKDTAFFINVARGSLVAEDDLIKALENHDIAGAGLDVFTREPLAEDSPLWDLPNALITAHSGAFTADFFDKILHLTIENYQRFCQGEELLHVIDKQQGY